MNMSKVKMYMTIVLVLGAITPTFAAQLYTPFLINLGYFQCTAVNISSNTVDVEIEIIDGLGEHYGPIGGDTPPGGNWYISEFVTADRARGVVRVKGGRPEGVRAMCVSRESPDAPSGLTAAAEPYIVNSTSPRGSDAEGR